MARVSESRSAVPTLKCVSCKEEKRRSEFLWCNECSVAVCSICFIGEHRNEQQTGLHSAVKWKGDSVASSLMQQLYILANATERDCRSLKDKIDSYLDGLKRHLHAEVNLAFDAKKRKFLNVIAKAEQIFGDPTADENISQDGGPIDTNRLSLLLSHVQSVGQMERCEESVFITPKLREDQVQFVELSRLLLGGNENCSVNASVSQNNGSDDVVTHAQDEVALADNEISIALQCIDNRSNRKRLADTDLLSDLQQQFKRQKQILVESSVVTPAPPKDLGLVSRDYSQGAELLVRIPWVNEFGSVTPVQIHYVTDRRFADDIVPMKNGAHSCCSCTDDCSDASKCSCQQLTTSGALFTGHPRWKTAGYKAGLLEEHLPGGVFECHSKCSCGLSCRNRVVRRPIRARLEIFMTADKGWGVRTLQPIRKGTFVSAYSGVVIPDSDDVARFKYFFGLDYLKWAEDECDGKNKAGFRKFMCGMVKFPGGSRPNFTMLLKKRFILDAETHGNVSRFFNHSCSPNLFVQCVFGGTRDPRFPLIAFFAKKAIPAGTELTIDYNYDISSMHGVEEIQCRCGSNNCRGRLI